MRYDTKAAVNRFSFVACLAICLIAGSAFACSTLLVGKRASSDGSVLLASSCDGDVMGLIYVMPAQSFPPGTKLPMYWNVPRPKTYAQYQANLVKGYDHVGSLSVSKTYRSLILGGNLESMTTGGLNEHGLNIAIEFLPMRKGLACDKGVVGPNSNHWTTSLIANGLLRARTAREAIEVIGDMIDRYGFLYYRAPSAGVALPIADSNETWLMEIFGPGEGWNPTSGKPGGVWCAQRIPDGEVGCSANRSRIGKIDIDDTDNFIVSENVHSLAEELGFWKRDEPFVWYNVYGGEGSNYNSLREWRALSLMAPSLNLTVTGDPQQDRYPFSVKPDKPVDVPRLIRTLRDAYEGTEFDLTEHPAFQTKTGKSRLARPWGPGELFELLKIRPERALCTPTSGYVFVGQLRPKMPASIGSCLWFAYGPANTSCFVPIHAGVTELPNSWSEARNFTRIDRSQPQWNFRLVHNLAMHLGYQPAVNDIKKVIEPAEQGFLSSQRGVEAAALAVLQESGPQQLTDFLNSTANWNLQQTEKAYDDLVDYLLLRYLVAEKEFAPAKLPRIEPATR